MNIVNFDLDMRGLGGIMEEVSAETLALRMLLGEPRHYLQVTPFQGDMVIIDFDESIIGLSEGSKEEIIEAIKNYYAEALAGDGAADSAEVKRTLAEIVYK